MNAEIPRDGPVKMTIRFTVRPVIAGHFVRLVMIVIFGMFFREKWVHLKKKLRICGKAENFGKANIKDVNKIGRGNDQKRTK